MAKYTCFKFLWITLIWYALLLDLILRSVICFYAIFVDFLLSVLLKNVVGSCPPEAPPTLLDSQISAKQPATTSEESHDPNQVNSCNDLKAWPASTCSAESHNNYNCTWKMKQPMNYWKHFFIYLLIYLPESLSLCNIIISSAFQQTCTSVSRHAWLSASIHEHVQSDWKWLDELWVKASLLLTHPHLHGSVNCEQLAALCHRVSRSHSVLTCPMLAWNVPCRADVVVLNWLAATVWPCQ